MTRERNRWFFPHAQRYLIAGVVALLPLWITWVVFNFVLTQLSYLGRPWVIALAPVLDRVWPGAYEVLLDPWFEWVLAILIMLLALYALGWTTTRVLGRRLLESLEGLLDRIPLVKAIYGATKKLVGALHAKPEGAQRVVLIGFPCKEMLAVALVMRTVVDPGTGRELAVVYVPTSPNPTSGYTEIMPVEDLVPTDWTLEEAMRFVVSGGTTAPEHMPFRRPPA
ncbi:MAG: DUF502 domain-containing protein [Burkholderiales bacterium]|nr:DUF502 domain-containing protein [Burkholderiales bacterium]